MPEFRRSSVGTQAELLAIDPTAYNVDLYGPIAIIREKSAGLYAITLRIAGRQFGLLEFDTLDYQLAQWSKVLPASSPNDRASPPSAGPNGCASRHR